MSEVQLWLSVVGAVSGAVSLAGVIYTAGYKIGQITKSLEYFDPKELGQLMARVDVLWAAYMSSISKTDPDEGMKTDVIVDAARKLGINLLDLKISRRIGVGERAGLIYSLDEVTPHSELIVEFTLKRDGRKIHAVTRFRVGEDMKILTEDLLEADAEILSGESDAAKRIEMLYRSYASQVATILRFIIQAHLRPSKSMSAS